MDSNEHSFSFPRSSYDRSWLISLHELYHRNQRSLYLCDCWPGDQVGRTAGGPWAQEVEGLVFME